VVVREIRTDRLLLRPMGVRDLEDFLALHREPAIIEFLGPATPERARQRLEFSERMWQERGHDLMAVLERSSGRFVGRFGMRYWPQFDETEAGWALSRTVWGRGYATEAARAAIEWGFTTFPLPYVTAMVRPDNSRSLAVTRRLGMTPIRDDVLHGVPVIVNAVDRRRWGAAAAPDELERLLAHVAEWARAQEGLRAVGLQSSTASGAELVFLSQNPASFPAAEQWAGELGAAAVLATARRGGLVEHRLRTSSQVELGVTIGAAPPADGARPIYDPEGCFTAPDASPRGDRSGAARTRPRSR
jgi:RimJ/RimL family protein N-acetyltransferase